VAREYNVVIGSGTIPHLAAGPPFSVPDGTFPVPSQREDLRVRQGTASVIVNPEDFSVAIGIRQQAVTVGSSATALPTSPLEFRRAIVIHNLGS
jgi:hypothetical protein